MLVFTCILAFSITNTVVGFSYKNCGSSSDPVRIKGLSVSPDPIKIPGNVDVSFNVSVTKRIVKMAADVEIHKKIWGIWVKIPCEEQVGSCTYSDLCTMIAKIPCPPEFKAHHIPCHCPVDAKGYVLPDSRIKVKTLPIPHSLESGDYRVSVTVSDGGDGRLACYLLELTLA